ncbi:MAG: hypothetical protein ACI89L_002669 [Phycisphaerales bacterium]|jgi:hypothetical protein
MKPSGLNVALILSLTAVSSTALVQPNEAEQASTAEQPQMREEVRDSLEAMRLERQSFVDAAVALRQKNDDLMLQLALYVGEFPSASRVGLAMAIITETLMTDTDRLQAGFALLPMRDDDPQVKIAADWALYEIIPRGRGGVSFQDWAGVLRGAEEHEQHAAFLYMFDISPIAAYEAAITFVYGWDKENEQQYREGRLLAHDVYESGLFVSLGVIGRGELTDEAELRMDQLASSQNWWDLALLANLLQYRHRVTEERIAAVCASDHPVVQELASRLCK